MSSPDLKQGVVRGFFWKAVENGGDQLITFVISIVLARLLGPEKYGTMSVMLIFVTIANVMIQTGFQTALIQKKEVTEDDFTSVFWTGLFLSALFYLLLFFTAPLIAGYFDDPDLVPMLRVLSLILFSGSVTSVLMARVARSFAFRIQCRATIAAGLLSGAAGIFAAFRGAGTWALILQQIIKNLLVMVILLLKLETAPGGKFRPDRLRSLFSYGWKVLVSGLIDTVYNNIYTPVIRKMCDPVMVGLYNRANQFPQVIAGSAAQTMQAVLLPAFSVLSGASAGDRAECRASLRRALKLSSYLMFPAMFGLAAVARPLVLFVLGKEWEQASLFLSLCALSFSVWHIHVANLQMINASGRSDVYLKLEIIKKAAGIAVLLVSMRKGVTAMIFAKALFDYVCTFINGYPLGKIIGYSPLSQWRDILPEFLCAGCMGLIVRLVGMLPFLSSLSLENPPEALLALSCGVLSGILVYAALSVLLKLESYLYLKDLLVQTLHRKR